MTVGAAARYLSEEMPEFEPDDAQMYLELPRNADPGKEDGRFADQRKANVELLRGLSRGDGERRARHREVGEITWS